jgi:ornithine carbamoyltransferase
MKFNVRVACPKGYEPDPASSNCARAAGPGHADARRAEAARGADVVVTDTWVSMGQATPHNKLAAMAPYQVNAALMAGWQARCRCSSTACPRTAARK